MNTASLSRKRTTALTSQIRQAKAILRELRETLEDLDDRRALARARKKNAGKATVPWHEAAKELGIAAPARRG